LCHHNCRDKVIVLDPNIRPGFITNEKRFRARLNKMLRVSDIVKVSDEDLNWIYPDNQPIAQKVVRLQHEGPKLVVLTKGCQDAVAWNRFGVMVEVPVSVVDVVDTVGAGDTFNAGLLANLEERALPSKSALSTIEPSAIKAALSFGAKVAGMTVSRAGANSPWCNEL
jgi:fructokinase